MAVPKRKQITIRMTLEDWRMIRDAAFSAGKEIGPFVAEWIQPKIAQLQRPGDEPAFGKSRRN